MKLIQIVKYLQRAILCALFLVVSNYSAFANDSLASLTTGGLVLVKNDDIAMISEDLYISRNEIIVNYVFENLTDKDIETLVAFPLPEAPESYTGDISGAEYDDNGNFIAEDFIGFQVWVEGKEIKPKLKIEKKIGISRVWRGEDVYQLTYYWKQKFPKNKQIKVRHSYAALYGGHWGLTSKPDFFDDEKQKLYCLDNSFRAALYKEFKKGKNLAWGNNLGYILTTGGNWADGVIRDFRLVVDKEKPDTIVSFCGTNVKKISPTQFEMRVKNFKPSQELYFLFVDKDHFTSIGK